VKPVVWIGDSLERVRGFPPEARREAGYPLERVQAGAMPVDWKPMPAKSQKTASADIDSARGRFRELVKERKRQ
jgi:phage-related protein